MREGRRFPIITGKILGFSDVFNPCNMLGWLVLLEKVKKPTGVPQSIVLIFFVSWFTQQENGVVGFSGC